MPRPDPLAPLAAAIADVASWLREGAGRGAIIGGVAASVLARPRVTRDIDCVVMANEDDVQTLLESAARFRLVPRVEDPAGFARETRILLLRHQPSAVDIDVSLGMLAFEADLVARAVTTDIAGARAPVATPEDLIVMKAVAGRPQDIVDIEGLLKRHPDLDLDRVREHVRQFAEQLEMPEIADTLETLLRGR